MNEPDAIKKLQQRIERLWGIAGIGTPAIRLQTSPIGDATPHVEIHQEKFDIVIEERGIEIHRRAGLNIEDAAYRYLFQMAQNHALKTELRERNPRPGATITCSGSADDGYSRWNWMALTISTLNKISPEFGARAGKYYSEILNHSPLKEYEHHNAKWPL